MTVKRIIKGFWRALRYPIYRQHVIGRIRQKIDEGTFYSWLWRGIQRRVWPFKPLALQFRNKLQTADAARDYIQALRFNQAPHPQ
jgi:hypothetical protein